MGAPGSDEGSLPLEQRISKPWALERDEHTNISLRQSQINYENV